MPKNILVTGGSGFIGSHVVDSLIKKKNKVTVYDIKSPKRKDVKFVNLSPRVKKIKKLLIAKN